MKTGKRNIDIFSLSFLDCICCGFGAIILLFVLSKFAEPVVIEELTKDLTARVLQLEEALPIMQGDARILNRDLTARVEQLSEEKERLARLQDDLSVLQGQYSASKSQ